MQAEKEALSSLHSNLALVVSGAVAVNWNWAVVLSVTAPGLEAIFVSGAVASICQLR